MSILQRGVMVMAVVVPTCVSCRSSIVYSCTTRTGPLLMLLRPSACTCCCRSSRSPSLSLGFLCFFLLTFPLLGLLPFANVRTDVTRSQKRVFVQIFEFGLVDALVEISGKDLLHTGVGQATRIGRAERSWIVGRCHGGSFEFSDALEKETG